MVRKWCLILCICFSVAGCASLGGSTQDKTKLLENSKAAIATLQWIKGVTDVVFSVGCSTNFPDGLCKGYTVASGLAKTSLETAKIAVCNYEETGSPLNEELLLTAVKGLSPYILKFDLIYKNPEEVIP